MKFKRDYKITISADSYDVCFWTATHKGAPIVVSNEDALVIYEMVKEIYNKLHNAYDLENRQTNG